MMKRSSHHLILLKIVGFLILIRLAWSFFGYFCYLTLIKKKNLVSKVRNLMRFSQNSWSRRLRLIFWYQPCSHQNIKSCFWSGPKHFGPVQTNLDASKTTSLCLLPDLSCKGSSIYYGERGKSSSSCSHITW